MYETVREVNGYKIERMTGTRGAYHVNVEEGKGWREFHTFKTIKAATAFCENIATAPGRLNPRQHQRKEEKTMTYEEYKKAIMPEIRKLNKMEFKSVEDERFYQGMVYGMIKAIERTAGFSEEEICKFNNEIMSKVKF